MLKHDRARLQEAQQELKETYRNGDLVPHMAGTTIGGAFVLAHALMIVGTWIVQAIEKRGNT